MNSTALLARRSRGRPFAFLALVAALYGCASDSGGSASGSGGNGGSAGSGGSGMSSGTAADCTPGCAALYKCGICLSDASGACVDEATCRSRCETTSAYFGPAACVAKAASCDAVNPCVGATSGSVGGPSQTGAGRPSGEACSISAECVSGTICCSAHMTCQTGGICLTQISSG